MKFVLKEPFKDNIYNLIRKIGYRFLRKNEEGSEYNFIRLLEGSGFPRFHIYLKVDSRTQNLIFNLHLDQKRPIYKGASAHSGEYEGEIVETEAERIKKILQE